MELTLNLGWALVAVWMLCAWVRTAPRRATDRRIQMVALAVVILILLPAISMTDDLMAAQNPAEVDCCARRDYDHAHHHAIFPRDAAPPQPVFAGLSFSRLHQPVMGLAPAPSFDLPALAPIQNRPPPAA
jgi:hypothetical protein